MKYPDHVMKIMASSIKPDGVEGTRRRRDFIDISGTKETNHFTYQNPFGIHFRYRHSVDNHNNQIHVPIYLQRTWGTKFWPDCNLAWYLVVLGIDITLVSGRF